jgi:DNA-binding MarR family transcriptional regulator
MPHASEASLPYLIKQLELAVRARIDEMVRPVGLTTTQYTALTVLARRPGSTSAQLARHSFVTPQTMSQIVGTLCTAGLVVRSVDPESRRQTLLYLTPRANRLLDGLNEPLSELERLLVSAVGRAEAAGFRVALIAARRACGEQQVSTGADEDV